MRDPKGAQAIEADLSRFHTLRYSDRWRFDENGHRRLTLREIWVRIQTLKGDAELVLLSNDGKPRWDYEHYLLADLFHALTNKPHPWRPKPVAAQKRTSKRVKAERITQRRFAARNRALALARNAQTERG